MLSMADKPMNCWATKNIHHDDPSFNFHHWLTSQLQATKSFSFTGYGPEFCSCCKTTYMLCRHISKHLNICWSTWLYLVFQAVSLVLGMWSNTLLHVTNKNVPWCVKFAEYLDFMLVFTVGLQVTWERLRQLGDSPVGRDGHTLRLVLSEGEGVLSRPASTGGSGKMCSAFMLLESCYTTWGWLTREGPVGSWSFVFFVN